MSYFFSNLSYSFLGKLICSVVNILSVVILSRILLPEDFGVFAVVYAVLSILAPFFDLGLMQVYMHFKRDSKRLKNIFYTFNFFISVFLSVIFIFISFILVAKFDDYVFLYLALVLSLSNIILSLSKNRFSVLVREKNFKRIMIVDVTAICTGNLIAILCAYAGCGVFSLVIKDLAYACSYYFVQKVFVKFKYQFVSLLILNRYKKILFFGLSISMNCLLNGFATSIDKIILKTFIDFKTLGGYFRSFQLVQFFDASLYGTIATPVYSYLVSTDKKNRKEKYFMFFYAFIILSGISYIYLFLVGDRLLVFLLGDKWAFAGTYLKIFSLWGVGRLFYSACSVLCVTEKTMKFWSRANIFAIFFVFIPLFILLSFNKVILHFILVYGLCYFVFWSVAFYYQLYKVYNDFRYLLKNLRIIFLLFFIFILSYISLYYCGIFNKLSDILFLLLNGLVVSFSSLFVLFVFDKKNLMGIFTFVKLKYNSR